MLVHRISSRAVGLLVDYSPDKKRRLLVEPSIRTFTLKHKSVGPVCLASWRVTLLSGKSNRCFLHLHHLVVLEQRSAGRKLAAGTSEPSAWNRDLTVFNGIVVMALHCLHSWQLRVQKHSRVCLRTQYCLIQTSEDKSPTVLLTPSPHPDGFLCNPSRSSSACRALPLWGGGSWSFPCTGLLMGSFKPLPPKYDSQTCRNYPPLGGTQDRRFPHFYDAVKSFCPLSDLQNGANDVESFLNPNSQFVNEDQCSAAFQSATSAHHQSGGELYGPKVSPCGVLVHVLDTRTTQADRLLFQNFSAKKSVFLSFCSQRDSANIWLW